MNDFSYVFGPDPAYIESLYNDFLKDSTTVDPEWKKFFEGFDFALAKNGNGTNGATNGATHGSAKVSGDQLSKEFAVYQLINAYRSRGHLIATTNPIRPRKDRHAHLA